MGKHQEKTGDNLDDPDRHRRNIHRHSDREIPFFCFHGPYSSRKHFSDLINNSSSDDFDYDDIAIIRSYGSSGHVFLYF